MPLDDLSVSDDLKRAGQAVERLQPNNLSKALAPASSSGSPTEGLVSKLPDALKAEETQQTEKRAAAGAAARSLEADQEARALLKAPLPPPPQHTPEPSSRDPWSNWASPAMALAMLASAFTRRPLTNALNAGAAVNEAYAKGDAASYKTAFERWKAETDYGIKLYEYQHEAYKDAIDTIDKDEKTALSKLKVLSSALNDEPMRRLADAVNIAGIVELDRQRRVATEKTKLETDQMREVGQAGHAVVEAGQRYRQAQQAGDAEGMRSAMQDLQIAQTTLKTLAAPQSVDHQTAAPGSVEGIVEQRAREHEAQTGQKPNADLMQSFRTEAREAESKATASGQAAERVEQLYQELKGMWQADPKNAGKEFTAQDQAELRRQAAAAVKGSVAQGRGAQAATQINALTGAIAELTPTLRNLVNLPYTATLSPFMGLERQTPDTLTSALQRTFTREIASDREARAVQRQFAGVTRALAIIEGQGRSQGLVGLTKSNEILIPQKGDTALDLMGTYAEMRQIAEQEAEVVKSGPYTSDKQAALLDKFVGEIRKAVPWTVQDVNDLIFRKGGKPSKESLAIFADRVLKRQRQEAGVPASAGDAGASVEYEYDAQGKRITR